MTNKDKSIDIPLLRDVQLTERDTKRLQPCMANWMRVHAHLSTLGHTPKAYEEMRLMLVYELLHGKRLDIVSRVFKRMCKLRRELDERELFAWCGK